MGTSMGSDWITTASESLATAVAFFLLGSGLVLGGLVTWELWRAGGRSKAWSIVTGTVVAYAPIVGLFAELGGAAGALYGWVIGYAVLAPISLLVCAYASCRGDATWRDDKRASTLAQTFYITQGAFFCLLIEDWIRVAGSPVLLALVWFVDLKWESQIEPRLNRYCAYVATALVTLYPLFAWAMLRPLTDHGINGYVLERISLPALEYSTYVAIVVAVVLALVNVARNLPATLAPPVLAALWPIGIWFFAWLLAPAAITSWGLFFVLLVAVAAMAQAASSAAKDV